MSEGAGGRLEQNGGSRMIIETAELSPNQKAAIEELLGRPLFEKDAISLRALSGEKSAEQRVAAENLCKFLAARERPRQSVSDEEFEIAFLEAMRTVRPNFTPVA